MKRALEGGGGHHGGGHHGGGHHGGHGGHGHGHRRGGGFGPGWWSGAWGPTVVDDYCIDRFGYPVPCPVTMLEGLGGLTSFMPNITATLATSAQIAGPKLAANQQASRDAAERKRLLIAGGLFVALAGASFYIWKKRKKS